MEIVDISNLVCLNFELCCISSICPYATTILVSAFILFLTLYCNSLFCLAVFCISYLAPELLIEQDRKKCTIYKSYLEVPVDNKTAVHVLKAQHDLSSVESNFLLCEHTMLRQVVVKVTTIHQVQDEAELLWCLKCVCHTHNEWAAFLFNRKHTNNSFW